MLEQSTTGGPSRRGGGRSRAALLGRRARGLFGLLVGERLLALGVAGARDEPPAAAAAHDHLLAALGARIRPLLREDRLPLGIDRQRGLAVRVRRAREELPEPARPENHLALALRALVLGQLLQLLGAVAVERDRRL